MNTSNITNKEDLIPTIIKEIQESQNNNILLCWPTGLGKSFAAIQYCQFLQSKKVLLLVAETAHKENWNKEIEKYSILHGYNLKKDTDNLLIECYASLNKLINTTWDLIIFDEIHHINTENRIDILSKIKTKNTIGLSATVNYDTLFYFKVLYKTFYVSRISLQEAIDKNWLPNPSINLIKLKLDNTLVNYNFIKVRGKKDKRVHIKCHYKDRWKYLNDKKTYPNLELEVLCTQYEKYLYLADTYDYFRRIYMETRNEVVKYKWLKSGLERKKFLGECKTPYVLELLKYLKDKRYICFCNSIEQAEILGGNNCIHSKKSKSQDIITKFNNKEIDNLYAVNMLQEGQNLTDIQVGIIIQLDGEERPFIQKLGRSLRAEKPLQFIFYYDNTKDLDYLHKVMDNIDENCINIIEDLNELKNVKYKNR